MKRKFILFLPLIFALFVLGAVTSLKYTGSFSGTYVGLDNGITNSAGLTVEQRAGTLSSSYQPASANLTNWSSIATSSKQAASANLTALATLNGSALTNLAGGPVVAGSTGITVTPTTNAATGQITYTLSVP